MGKDPFDAQPTRMTKRIILGRLPHLAILVILVLIHRDIPAFLFILDVLYVFWVDEFLFITALELGVVLRVLLVRHDDCVG
jgi:hypothetical protein